MKKSAIALILSSLFLLFTVSTSCARYRHHRYYHHHGHSGVNVLVPLGFGLIAGAIIAGAAAQPSPPRTIVYRQAPPPPRTIVYRQAPPPPVVVSHPTTYYSYNTPNLPAEEFVINRVSITAGLLNVRTGPGLDTPIIDQVRRGMVLDVIGAGPGWLYIRTASGLHGWVMSKYTAVKTTPEG